MKKQVKKHVKSLMRFIIIVCFVFGDATVMLIRSQSVYISTL